MKFYPTTDIWIPLPPPLPVQTLLYGIYIQTNISQLINRELIVSLYIQTNISQLINREIIVSLYIQTNISQLINREVTDSLIYLDEHSAIN